MENAFIESFNGRLQDECLNVHQFTPLAEAQAIIEAWRMDYNHSRPHSSLGHLTPNEFLKRRQGQQIDVLPKNWTSQNWNNRLACSPPTREGSHEEEQVFG